MSEAAALGPVRAVVVTALVVVGTFFLFVGTVGLLRLPDVYNRMHATSKAATLGASSILLAGFVYFGPGGAGLTSLVGILFLFLTAPTGAHMISRAAQKMGIEFVGRATWPDAESGAGGVGGDGEGDGERGNPDSSPGVDGSPGVDD